MWGAIAGAVLGGLMSSHSAKKQAQHNADLSIDNWKYQQSNAHQLEVQDLKNAGLNPILSATNSQMAGISPVQGSDPGNFANNINSALQGYLDRESKQELQANDLEIERMKLENEKLRTQIQRDEADAQISKWHSEGKLLDIQADYTSSKKLNEANESAARIKQINQNIQNSISELRSLNALREKQGNLYGSQSAYYNKLVDKTLEEIGKVIQERTGVSLSNKQLIRQLQDPDNAIHRDYRGSWIGQAIGYLGEVVRDVSPFKGYSVSNRGVSGRN